MQAEGLIPTAMQAQGLISATAKQVFFGGGGRAENAFRRGPG